MVKTYISLTKPGIIWGNLVAATGGFMLAAQGSPNIFLYVVTMIGTALVVASGCVFNNVVDADIDALMQRTAKRALVVGAISKKNALIFATLLAFSGFGLLGLFTNIFTLAVATFGFYAYVVLYTLMYKRSSVHGTVVGSLSGASPPIIGYLAVVGRFDFATLCIFLGFCAWQMPHTYAIGIFREQDFLNSRIPLLPLLHGIKTCQRYMLGYILLFFVCVLGLYIFDYVGVITLVTMGVVCGYWIYQSIFLFKPQNNDFVAAKWGKKMFLTSIIAITLFSFVISVDYVPRQNYVSTV